MSFRQMTFALLLVGFMLNGGCKSVQATATPGVDVSRFRTFYVGMHEKGGMDQVITDELNLMGHTATMGPESSMPANVDVLVTFNPKWQWDITMYLLELQIEFRNPRDKTVFVSGRSYRPSLQRTSGSLMTRELLQTMFNAQPATSASSAGQKR